MPILPSSCRQVRLENALGGVHQFDRLDDGCGAYGQAE
jgi:hypothetical protein